VLQRAPSFPFDFRSSSAAPRERMPLHPGLPGGERSVRLIECDTLADVKPSFKNDTDIVPIPPRQSAFSNREKVIKRDVERYRNETQSIRMHQGVHSANVVSHNAQFSAAIKEQQAIHGMFDHR
jgi:hypothetical protein